MNTLTTKYGKLYAITIAIFFTFSIFFGVSTFYPEPDFDEIIGEQPIYPIKPDNMSKEEVLVFEEKLKEHRVAEDAWWERRVEEQEKYEGTFKFELDGKEIIYHNDQPFKEPIDLINHAFKHLKETLAKK